MSNIVKFDSGDNLREHKKKTSKRVKGYGDDQFTFKNENSAKLALFSENATTLGADLSSRQSMINDAVNDKTARSLSEHYKNLSGLVSEDEKVLVQQAYEYALKLEGKAPAENTKSDQKRLPGAQKKLSETGVQKKLSGPSTH